MADACVGTARNRRRPVCGTSRRGVAALSVVGSGIPASLTGKPGDPVRGRAIVANRQNTCLLCHSGPFPEKRLQGNVSPTLKGTGARWTEAELRLRLVDPGRLNPATIMPSYYKVDGLTRVASAWRDKPISLRNKSKTWWLF